MTIYDIPVTTIDGQEQTLAGYHDRVLLIVNVASKCAFTKQYAGLEDLYRRYQDKGLVVLGFPCDQFGHQEPGTEAEVQAFCSLTYNVSFPMFAKVLVNGEQAHPLYKYLKSMKRGLLGTQSIKWNFTKFLVSRTGEVMKRYSPLTKPEQLNKDIEKLLR
jgi:glutathione peroxidase